MFSSKAVQNASPFNFILCRESNLSPIKGGIKGGFGTSYIFRTCSKGDEALMNRRELFGVSPPLDAKVAMENG